MYERGAVIPVMSFKVRDGVPETRVKSRTHQAFAKDANINHIMKRYQKTGLLVDPGSVRVYRQAQFGDFSNLVDLPSTLETIRKAELNFMALPALVRERFNNDVSNLLDFVQDPKNLVEAIDLKLLPEQLRPVVAPSDDVPENLKETPKA
ncbi:MAG: internal scaffolding protein [Microviridae sp.]|nr:MAG: internal scaffolding protein [Microviridae sp.]